MSATSLQISGWGAVSPAGWSAAALTDAVLHQHELPAVSESRHPDAVTISCRRVPAPAPLSWLRHPRLRRASPISRFSVAAALEALRFSADQATTSPDPQLGIIFAVQNGSVNFSRRFYSEALSQPGLASPILFPETVFNAPSSHISALLQAPSLNYTLVGDAGVFINALDVAAQWLTEDRVSHCLVVSAEEIDWLSAEALGLYPGQKIATEGAAALCLTRTLDPAPGSLLLEQLTTPALITRSQTRSSAIQALRAELGAPTDAALISAVSGSALWDRPHIQSFADWTGPRFTLQPQLGHAFSVLGGWQCALACELLHRRHQGIRNTVVPADTGAAQAVAAWFSQL